MEKVICIPPVLGRNYKVQAILPFSPAGTSYGSRYSSYTLSFEPADDGIAVIVWDILYDVEGGAIRFRTPGNKTIGPQNFVITRDLVRLGVASVRGNLPYYSREDPCGVYLENLTSYEVDLVISCPALAVPKQVAETLLATRMG